MDVNKHERLSNFALTHTLKKTNSVVLHYTVTATVDCSTMTNSHILSLIKIRRHIKKRGGAIPDLILIRLSYP